MEGCVSSFDVSFYQLDCETSTLDVTHFRHPCWTLRISDTHLALCFTKAHVRKYEVQVQKWRDMCATVEQSGRKAAGKRKAAVSRETCVESE